MDFAVPLITVTLWSWVPTHFHCTVRPLAMCTVFVWLVFFTKKSPTFTVFMPAARAVATDVTATTRIVRARILSALGM